MPTLVRAVWPLCGYIPSSKSTTRPIVLDSMLLFRYPAKMTITRCILAPLLFITCLACGGGGGPNAQDLEARCSISGEKYDAFTIADGPDCPSSNNSGTECYPGDMCEGDGICTLVGSDESASEASCILLTISYQALNRLDGPDCNYPESGWESLQCYPGDKCIGEGNCRIVVSGGGAPVTALLGMKYHSFYDADGPECNYPESGWESLACFVGDICTGEGNCEIVLSAKGGGLDESELGQIYTAASDGGGRECTDPDANTESQSCLRGDICQGFGNCEIVSSAKR